MTKSTGKIHYAWFIFIVCLGIMGGLVGILLNCTGVIFAQIIEEFGFRTGDLSIYYTIRSLTRAAALGFASGLFFKKNSKAVLIGLTTMTCIAYMSMAWYTQLWQWYISAFFVGVGTSYTGMGISVLLANWFHTGKGFVMGLAMSSSGLFGALINPLCSKLIETVGWRGACISLGIMTLVVVSVPAALFLVLTPEEKGLKPYGYDENAAISANNQMNKGVENIPAYIFPLTVTIICLACLIGAASSLLPIYTSKLGYAVAMGAMLASFTNIGNVVGKLLTGWLADRIGVFKAVSVTFIMVITSMFMFMLCGNSQYALCGAALLFGTIFAVDASVPPLLFMSVWGDNYTKQLKNFQTISFTIGAFSSSIIPYIYDFTGSFNVIFILGVIFVAVSLALTWWLKGWVEKQKAI